MDRKQLVAELKADKPGDVSAIFSRFNVVDLDGDVTLPGAFDDGAEARLAAWGHNWGSLPVGKGVIHADNEKAVFDGSFFLNTTHGADTYNTVKGLGGLQEWSYGFDIVDAQNGQFNGENVRFLRKLRVHEVSPVMLGAGIGTGTAAIKAVDDALIEDVKAQWTAAYINNLPDSAFAYIEPGGEKDAEGKTTPRSLRHFPHHDSGGAIDLPHLRNALARAPQSEFGDQALPHLKRHAASEGVGQSAADLPFAEHAESVLAEVTRFVTRSQERGEVLAKEGRTFSSANVSRLTQIADAIAQGADALRAMLAAPEPKMAPDVLSEQEKLRAMADELERWRTYYNLVPA